MGLKKEEMKAARLCTRIPLRTAFVTAARRGAPQQLRPLATDANDALDSVDYKLVRAMSQAANEALFRKLDANQDGVLDRDELAEMAKAIGHESSAAEVDKLMKAADTNGDGLLQLDEFIAFMTRRQFRMLTDARETFDTGRHD